MKDLEIADALAELARSEPEPKLSAITAAAMIERAAEEAERPAFAPPVRRWPIYAGLAVAAVIGLVVGSLLRMPTEPSSEVAAPGEAPTRLHLPSGDEVGATPGARYAIGSAEVDRRIRLEQGTLSFDVRPLDGGSFEVVTPHLIARVVGTVFTVEVRSDASTVRVYEGRVEVEHDGERLTVSDGESLVVGAATHGEDPLAGIARAAAERRARAQGRVASPRVDPPRAETMAETSATRDTPTDGLEAHERPVTGREVGTALDTPAVSPALARHWLATGEAPRALEAARGALRAGPSAAWSMIEGDGLRVLGHFPEAALAYERAGRDEGHRVRAGYLLAVTRAERLSDPRGALRALADHGCADEGSPLAERSLLLQHRLLERLGRSADADRAASVYLARYPDGPGARQLRPTSREPNAP